MLTSRQVLKVSYTNGRKFLRKKLADTRKNNQILKSQSQKYRNDNVDQVILQKEIEQFKEELEAERQKNLKLESKLQNLNRNTGCIQL